MDERTTTDQVRSRRTFTVINLADQQPRSMQSSYLVKGFIHHHSVICLCGESNHGKSMLAMRIALAVAGDFPVFGHGDPFGSVLTPGNVLYIGKQNGMDEDYRRLQRLARGQGLTHPRGLEPYGVHYADGLRYGTNFARNADDVDELRSVLGDIPNLQLIIFDPFTSLFGIGEQESGAYTATIQIIEDQLLRLADDGPSIIFTANVPRGQAQKKKLVPRNPALVDGPDAVIGIKEEEPRNSGLFTVIMSKQRQGRILTEPVKFRLIAKGPKDSPVEYRFSYGWGNPWAESDASPAPAVTVAPPHPEATKDRTRAAIAMLRLVTRHRQIDTRKAAFDLLHQATGASASTVKRAIALLGRKGWMTKEPPYRIRGKFRELDLMIEHLIADETRGKKVTHFADPVGQSVGQL
ncbi:MAG TPA: AAA family ATPase [Sporichthya sp.]|jgi:AAA domain|nr:AAA family ATPase [Sporichthya sp.]